jgi:Asp-tRNA(Asn)/Glu-tRNA(Gln) amidotransferase B subunit
LPEASRLRPLVEAVESERVRPEAFEAILDRLLREDAPAERIVKEYAHGDDDQARLRAAVEKARARRGELPYKPGDDQAALRWAFGEVMPAVLGRLEPGEVRDALSMALELEEVSL